MSESKTTTPAATDSQFEMLAADVEARFSAAEDAMAELRSAIVRLKAYRPGAQASHAVKAEEPSPESTAELAAALEGIEAVEAEPAASEEPVAEQDDEAKREEVSRAVAEAKAEMAPKVDDTSVGIPFWPGPKKDEPEEEKSLVEDYGMDSTSEGSWPIARPEASKPPLARAAKEAEKPVAVEAVEAVSAEPVETEEAADEDEAAKREEVARIVAQMRDGGGEAEPETEAEESDEDESKRQDVAKMVADLRAGVDVDAEDSEDETPEASEGDDEMRRQEVARMVAEMRQKDGAAADDAAEGEDDESKREDVASMVARMRAEMSSEETPSKDEAVADKDDPDAEVRDEVRRAVEAARAEMASGYKSGEAEDAAAEGKSKFSFPDWQTTHVEPSGPPVIVIKDPEGRVELARVYETLSRVDCDENAALLNYTPHSVTVGLNAKASVPAVEAMTEAVEAVFGRKAVVDSDGVRVNVQIGKDLKGKDNAA